jgi:plastocyanin
MKRITLLAVSTAAFFMAGSAQAMATYDPASGSTAPVAAVNPVGIYDNRFEPRTLNVPVGMTVQWVNYGMQVHTVTSTDMAFDSGDLAPGKGFSMTFKQPGVYHYFCRHHPEMSAVIIVGL